MAAASYFDIVQTLYIAYYQRPADSGGLVYWAQRLDDANGNLQGVIDAFANSAEAVRLYDTNSDGKLNLSDASALIDKVYLGLFGRAPDAGGKAFYLTALQAGRFPDGRPASVGNVVLDILNGAQNQDAVAIANKLIVSNRFTETVDGRNMDDPQFGQGGDLAATYNEADELVARAYLATVTANAATVRTEEQVYVDVVNNIANPGDRIIPSSPRYVMETDVDTLVGNALNDTFVGRIFTGDDQELTTYQPGDKIDGGAGNNLLQLFIEEGGVADDVSVSNFQTLELSVAAAQSGEDFARVDMQDWDDSLQTINVTSQASDLAIVDQQTIADVNLKDNDYWHYTYLGYDQGVAEGAADHLDVSVNNWSGELEVDFIESIHIDVLDRRNPNSDPNRYNSYVELDAGDATEIEVTGGVAGQWMALEVNDVNYGEDASASLDATAFVGDLDVYEIDGGSDYQRWSVTFQSLVVGQTASVTIDGETYTVTATAGMTASEVASALAEKIVEGEVDFVRAYADGDRVLVESIDGHDIAATSRGAVRAVVEEVTPYNMELTLVSLGAGDDYVEIRYGDLTRAAEYDLGEGDNELEVTGYWWWWGGSDNDLNGTVTAGGGDDEVYVNDGSINGTVSLGNGDNVVYAGEDLSGAVQAGSGDDELTIDGDMRQWGSGYIGGANVNLGNGDNTIEVGGEVRDGSVIITGSGDDSLTISNDLEDLATVSLGDGDDSMTVGDDIESGELGLGHAVSVDLGNGDNTLLVDDEIETDESDATIDITAGDGNDYLSVSDGIYGNSAADSNTITVMLDGGDDTLHVGYRVDDNGVLNRFGGERNIEYVDIAMGEGTNVVASSSTVIGSNVTFGDGAGNVFAIGAAVTSDAENPRGFLDLEVPEVEVSSHTDTALVDSTVTLGDGAGNVVWIGGIVENSTITAGDGGNSISVGDDVDAESSITTGGGSDSLYVDDDLRGTVSMGDGNDSAQIGNDVDGSLDVGDGDNTIVVSDDVDGSVTAGSGDDDFAVGEDIAGTVDLGDGDNTALIHSIEADEHSTTGGATLQTGSGDDAVTIHRHSDAELGPISNDGDGATISTGGGDDTVTVQLEDSSVEIGSLYISDDFGEVVVSSNGLIDGGAGDDDVLRVEALDDATVVQRTHLQQVTINLARADDSNYYVGDVVTVTVGDLEYTYTVKASDIVQSNGVVTGQNVATALIAKINADAESPMDATASLGVITLTENEDPQIIRDVEITAGVESVNDDGDVTPLVTTVQVGNAIVKGFETLELVATNPIADEDDGEGSDELTKLDAFSPDDINDDEDLGADITADFAHIEGVETINLISQVEVDADEIGASDGGFSDGNDNDTISEGTYDDREAGDDVVFNLFNLNGTETINLVANEVTATGQQQVDRIYVGNDVDDHDIGDVVRVSVSIGGTDYDVAVTITETMLRGVDEEADANNIAKAIASALTAELPEGFGVEVDGHMVTIVGADGVPFSTSVEHVRDADYSDSGSTEFVWDLAWEEFVEDEPDVGGAYDNNDEGLSVGDVITVTTGEGSDEVTVSYTVTAEDLDSFCDRPVAEYLAAKFAELLVAEGVDATAERGALFFAGDISWVITRADVEYIGQDTVQTLQYANPVDDTYIDVTINASLSADADTDDDTMVVNLDATGATDIAFTFASDDTDGFSDGQFENLELDIVDGFDHYIDLYGDEGNFTSSLTVTGGTAGQDLYFDYVLSKSVNADIDANVTINQFADYYDVNPYSDDEYNDAYLLLSDGDVVNVVTGSGDDQLITYAPALFNEGSTVDLGSGENTLSLGYEGASLTGPYWWALYGEVLLTVDDTAQIGDIDYTGGLHRLEFLTDIELGTSSDDAADHVITMPGGVTGVDELYFDDLETILDDAESFWWWGLEDWDANLTIVGMAPDASIHANESIDLGADYRGASNIEAFLTVEGAQNLTVTTDYDDIEFNVGNEELQSLTVDAGDDAQIHISSNTDISRTIDEVSITGYDEARLYVESNDGLEVTIGTLALAGEDAELIIEDNSDTEAQVGLVGGIAMSVGADADEGDIDVDVETNDSSHIELGDVQAVNLDDDVAIDIQFNELSVVTIGNLAIQAGDDVDVNLDENEQSEITVGDIDIQADDEVDIDIDLNRTSNDSDAIDAEDPDATITVGNITAITCIDDADFDIYGNDDDTAEADLKITVGTVTFDAEDEADVYITYNDDVTISIDDVSLTVGVWGGSDGDSFGNDAEVVVNDNYDNSSITIGDITATTYGRYGDARVSVSLNYDDTSVTLGDLRLHTNGVVDASDDVGPAGLSDTGFEADALLDLNGNYDGVSITIGNAAEDAEAESSDDAPAIFLESAGEDADLDIEGNRSDVTIDICDDVVIEARNDATMYVTGNTDDVDVTVDGDLTITGNTNSDDGEPGQAGFFAGYNFETDVIVNGDVSLQGTFAAAYFFINSDSNFSMEDLSVEAVDGVGAESDDDSGPALLLSYLTWDTTISAKDTTISSESSFAGAVIALVGSDSLVELTGDVTILSGTVASDSDAEITLVEASDEDPVTVEGGSDATLLVLGVSDDSAIYIGANDDEGLTRNQVDVLATNNAYVALAGTSDSGIVVGNLEVVATNGDGAFVVDDHFDDTDTDSDDAFDTEVDIGTIDIHANDDAYFLFSPNWVDDGAGGIGGALGGLTGPFSDADYISDGDGADISAEDVTITAGEDVNFIAAAVTLDEDDAGSVTLGDIHITAGLASSSDTEIDAHVNVWIDNVGGTTSLTADASAGSDSAIYAMVRDAADLTEVTLAAEDGELYMFGDIGTNSDGDFTLDLSGMTGEFEDVTVLAPTDDDIVPTAQNYDPQGYSWENDPDASDNDTGTYVVNVDADFGLESNDNLIVKIGNGDLIYNAQHSTWAQSDDEAAYANDSDDGVSYPDLYSDDEAGYGTLGSDTEAFIGDDASGEDWNGEEGWFSLGEGLDLEPQNEEVDVRFSSVSVDEGTSDDLTFTVTYEGEQYTLLMYGEDSDDAFDFYSDSTAGQELDDLLAAIGEGAAVGDVDYDDINDILTITFVGRNDGSELSFEEVSDLFNEDNEATGGDYTGTFEVVSDDLATDGNGQLASEIFVFTGTDIGEVVIGGFQINAVGIDEDTIDFLDFSQFVGVNDLGDLNFLAEEDAGGASVGGDDGYFNDVIITSANGAFSGYIRLVGVAEQDDWQAQLAASIRFSE